METVIGLGTVGCNIALVLDTLDLYDVYLIDTDPREHINFKQIPKFPEPEQYEGLDFSYLKEINTSVLFITCGVEYESAATLSVLSNLKHCKVHILYVKPETEFVYGKKKLLETSVFNILQEYTRSGMFERMIIVDNSVLVTLDGVAGHLPIIGYYDKINEIIALTINGINVCEHQTPVKGQQEPREDVSRIATMGRKNIDTGDEKSFFSLEHIREVWYYYTVNQTRLETDGGLFEQIRAQLKNKKGRIKYGIYRTSHEDDYCYSLSYSSIIQDLKLPK